MAEQFEIIGPAGISGLYQIRQNGLLGIYREGEGILILGDWEEIGPFREGLAMVFKSDRSGERKWGLIDEEGRLVTPCQWFYEEEPLYPELCQCSNGQFVNGYALVRDVCRAESWRAADGYRILTRQGQLIGSRRWSYFEELFDGSGAPIRVYSHNPNSYGFPPWVDYNYDSDYDELPSYQKNPDDYTELSYFRGFYYLTPEGTVLTPQGAIPPEDTSILPQGWWETREPFSGSTVFADSYILMNRAGQFRSIHWQNTGDIWWDEYRRGHNRCTFVRKDSHWGILDKTGNLLSPCQWDAIFNNEGLILVEKDGKQGLLFPDGREMVPCRMECIKISRFEELVYLQQDGLWGAIDRQGHPVIPCQWESLEKESWWCYAVSREGKYGLLDEDGAVILDCRWEEIRVENRDYIKVKQGNLWGLLDGNFQPITPCNWRSLEVCDGGIRVKKGGIWQKLDFSGKPIPEDDFYLTFDYDYITGTGEDDDTTGDDLPCPEEPEAD